jgi:arsenite-transporting ATPase
MTPRTILYTGKGGVGKTSVAAATARSVARHGLRTIVLSTDPAHSLSDSLETQLEAEPTPIDTDLWGQEVHAEHEMERNWHAVQDWLGALLAERGMDRILAEEMTVPPGMDELFSLLQIKRLRESGEFDVIVVDCAPTGETLRLLSFPDVARWWLEKVFPWERRIVSAARPIAKTFLDVKLPGNDVYADVERLVLNLIAMNEILRDHEHSSIRLVMNPERMVVKEAQRTFTYLNLFGYLTDAVVVNRIFPSDVRDGYFSAWRNVQQGQIELIEQAFSPIPLLRAPFFEQEVMGVDMLDRLADAMFAGSEPHALFYQDLTQELAMGNGTATLRLRIPFAEKAEIELKKVGLELIVRVAGHKRNIVLPPSLAPYRPREAKFDSGALRVTFERPDGDGDGEDRGRARPRAAERR